MAVSPATKTEKPTEVCGEEIEVSSKLPSRADLDKVADLPVLDVAGNSHTFKSLHSNDDSRRRQMIIFIRHFFCGNCQEYLRTLSSSVTPEALLALHKPTEIIVIGCGDPDLIPMYTKETACPFPIYADPTKKLYELLGMTRTLSLGNKAPGYMQTSVPYNMIKSIYQVLRSGSHAMKGGDFSQVGGEFLFEAGKVTWCHRMRNTRDHAEILELRKVLEIDGDEAPRRKRWSSNLGRALSNRRQSWSRSRSRTGKRSPRDSVMEKVQEEQGDKDVKGNSDVHNEVASNGYGGVTGAVNGTLESTPT